MTTLKEFLYKLGVSEPGVNQKALNSETFTSLPISEIEESP